MQDTEAWIVILELGGQPFTMAPEGDSFKPATFPNLQAARQGAQERHAEVSWFFETITGRVEEP